MEYNIKALEKLRPNAKWQMTNNNYDELVWLDEEQTKPTKKEVDDEILRLVAQQELQQQIAEAKQYLNNTDHKFYGDYELKSDETLEDLENIRVQRSIARTFIRENEDV